MKRIKILGALLMAAWGACGAQEAPDTTLGRHDFFYAGQSKQRRMFIVKAGKVDWRYADRLGKGEISDAVLMTDGNILVAHQYGIAEIDPQGNTNTGTIRRRGNTLRSTCSIEKPIAKQ